MPRQVKAIDKDKRALHIALFIITIYFFFWFELGFGFAFAFAFAFAYSRTAVKPPIFRRKCANLLFIDFTAVYFQNSTIEVFISCQ